MSSAGNTPWYLNRVTQGFNGGTEKGVDLGVPYHTPITPLFPGTVTGVTTGPYGQEVNVTGNLNGTPVTAAYVHLDQALVSVGQQVNQNSNLGVSGGQLVGGFHPASPSYSSGPHIEFSLWPSGTTPYTGTPYDPSQFVGAVQQSGGALVGTLGSGAGSLGNAAPNGNAALISAFQSALASIGGGMGGVGGSIGNNGVQRVALPSLSGDIAAGVSGGLTGAASGIGSTILQALGVSRMTDLLWRIGLVVVGVVLVLIVAQAVTAKGIQNVTESVAGSQAAQTARRVAALAG